MATGSDGVPPVLTERSAPVALDAGASAAAAAAAGTLPASMAGLAPKFRYVLLKLGPITVTRKGLGMAVSALAAGRMDGRSGGLATLWCPWLPGLHACICMGRTGWAVFSLVRGCQACMLPHLRRKTESAMCYVNSVGWLQVALTELTFIALQSASLCLVTTPPERMAAAVGK